MSFFLLLTITYPPARRDATASADIVPIGELSAVDTALLEVVPAPFADVADASVVASGFAPVCPPELLPSAAPDGVTVMSGEWN